MEEIQQLKIYADRQSNVVYDIMIIYIQEFINRDPYRFSKLIDYINYIYNNVNYFEIFDENFFKNNYKDIFDVINLWGKDNTIKQFQLSADKLVQLASKYVIASFRNFLLA